MEQLQADADGTEGDQVLIFRQNLPVFPLLQGVDRPVEQQQRHSQAVHTEKQAIQPPLPHVLVVHAHSPLP